MKVTVFVAGGCYRSNRHQVSGSGRLLQNYVERQMGGPAKESQMSRCKI